MINIACPKCKKDVILREKKIEGGEIKWKH